MPKNNQSKEKDLIKSNEKKEKYYLREINRYQNGELRKDELNKLNFDKQNIYLKKELSKRFNKNVIFKCHHCAVNLLYNNGAVSDDELLLLPNVKKI